MSETMCGVCGKKPAQVKCSECQVDLCDECVREVRIDSTRPGQRMMGRITSPMKSAQQKIQVCENCFKEKEFLG